MSTGNLCPAHHAPPHAIDRTKPPPPPESVHHQWDQFYFTHATLPYSHSSEDFGSMWQPLDKRCRLRNLVQQYITPNRSAVDPASSIKVMAISDSTGRSGQAGWQAGCTLIPHFA